MSDECAYCGGRGAGCHPAGVRPDSPAPLSPKYSTDPRLNAALEADARKLEAMGGDPGITLDGPAPLSPIALDQEVGLDFEAAHIAAFGSASGFYLSKRKAKCREHLNAQVRAIVARVAQEEREKARREFAAECRTRLVAHDPVGLKTGPLYDWLTKEMGA